MIDPKITDKFQDFKVFIKDWYGSFPITIQALNTIDAVYSTVENGLSNNEVLEGPLSVKVNNETYEVIENSDGELLIKKV